MLFRLLAVALLAHLTAAQSGCNDTISRAQCEALDCAKFPDLAQTYCRNTCQLCHTISPNTSASTTTSSCEDHMSFSHCHELDCQLFPSLAKDYCRRTCGLCPKCVDRQDNCAVLGKSFCENQYLELAKRACPAYCNLCD